MLIKSVPLDPLAITGNRSLISALFLLVFLRDFRPRELKYQFGGAVFYAATVILFVVANKLTTAVNVILLQYSSPIPVALIGSWFLREKVKLKDWLFIFSLIGGIFLFFMDEITLEGTRGNILAILGGLACFAVFNLRDLRRKHRGAQPAAAPTKTGHHLRRPVFHYSLNLTRSTHVKWFPGLPLPPRKIGELYHLASIGH